MAIDLHTHTDESDGSLAPSELLRAAEAVGLEALGITDHDTFNGCDIARAENTGPVELVYGIELSTRARFAGAAKAAGVHLLGYFVHGAPPAEFREWLAAMLRYRRERNARLAARLQSLGLEVTLAEAEALGRSLTGRPHFARVLVAKGYAKNHDDAFRRYLGERGAAYVEREEPSVETAVSKIAATGGIASLAHPVRIEEDAGAAFESFVAGLRSSGLAAVEVWHSDHSPEDTERYRDLAVRLGLAMTGGSDFHGDAKPGVALGIGRGHMAIPRSVLDNLKALR